MVSRPRLWRRQAKRTALRLAKYLKTDDRASLCSSDLKRAAETAAIIASKTGLVPQYSPELRDLNNGEAAKHRTYPTESILDWSP